MREAECVEFLRWALPRLGLRVEGFRNVRGQVHKRLRRRVTALGLGSFEAYRRQLDRDAAEWGTLASLCRVTVSRFYRDRILFEALRTDVLPALAERVRARGGDTVRAWSAGCASGEEPYSLALTWRLGVGPSAKRLALDVLATDADPHLLERARRASYPGGSLRELPPEWRPAFEERDSEVLLREAQRAAVRFEQVELRSAAELRGVSGPFELILCRNVAFTYFGEEAQRTMLDVFATRLASGGALVAGLRERVPAHESFEPWRHAIWRKT